MSPVDYNDTKPSISSSSGLDMTLSPGATLGKHGLDSNYSFGLGSDVDIESLLAPSTFGAGVSTFDSTGFTDHQPSLVDPALHLPVTSTLAANDRIAPGLLAPASSSAAAAADAIFTNTATKSATPVTSVAPASVQAKVTAPSPPKSTTKKASAPKKRKSVTPAATTVTAASTPAAATAAAETVTNTPKPVSSGDAEDDEANALAIEEDKRRRNTAASARFRVKKKQREQALEQSAKELRERVAQLESEVGQLRTENTWLKGLIVDKPADATADMTEAMVAAAGSATSKKRSADEISA